MVVRGERRGRVTRWLGLCSVLLSVALAAGALGAGVPVEAQRPRTHVVREGDTLARIARRFHVSAEDIREANGLRGDRVRLGQTLIVPRPGEDPSELRDAGGEARETATDADTARARARAERLGLGRTSVGQRLLAHPPERRWVVGAGSARMRGTLRLPVDGGHFIRGWGSGAGGYHLAVDIRGRPGVTIRAAETGIVAYTGDGISGYGNFVMLVHPNGWVTAYAHNRENLVLAGQMVERGNRIATLGNTGTAHGAHLHFMLIRDGEHCDPAPLFRPHIGPRGPQVEWRRRRRPPEVQCLPRSARPHPGRAARRAAEAEAEGDADDDMPEASEAEASEGGEGAGEAGEDE